MNSLDLVITFLYFGGSSVIAVSSVISILQGYGALGWSVFIGQCITSSSFLIYYVNKQKIPNSDTV